MITYFYANQPTNIPLITVIAIKESKPEVGSSANMTSGSIIVEKIYFIFFLKPEYYVEIIH